MRSCSLMLTWMSIRGKGILSSEYWETTRLSVLSFVEKMLYSEIGTVALI